MAKYPHKIEQETSIEAFTWMAGIWHGQSGNDSIEEHWSEPSAGTLMGMFKWSGDDQVRFYELMTLEEEGGALVFRIKHFNPGLKGWEEKDEAVALDLVLLEENRAVFIMRDRDEDRWMVYHREDPQTLIVYFESEGASPKPEDTFRYHLVRPADPVERTIRGEAIVQANLDDVWQVWTTEEGVKSFFAPGAKINLVPDGPYEIYFDPSAPPGERGGDGLKVTAVQPKKMLSFTWNAPLSLPDVRPQRTLVTIRFYPLGPDQTRVTLYQSGWGTGGQWDKAYRYFERAWNEVVLPRLQYRFEHGPVDWDNPP